MAAYAKQAKETAMVEWATEIKVRAERKCGEILRDTISHGGDRKSESRSDVVTLIDVGLTKNESSRYQKLAAISDDKFEEAVGAAKEIAGEVTTAFMLRVEKKGVIAALAFYNWGNSKVVERVEGYACA